MNRELSRQPSPGGDAGRRRLLLQVIGQQRAGNHAIIAWLASLFPRAAHFNDLPHAYFRTADLGKPLAGKEELLVFSFEDSPGKRTREGSLPDRVDLVDPAAFPGFDVRTLYFLRDPYNCWASRVKAKEIGRTTASRALSEFVEDWTALARLCLEREESFVLYNSWFADAAYRRQVCARLGGSYSEQTLGDVFGYGGGSSFDGHARPSYRTILGKLDYYMSKGFRRRFLKAPGSYVGRLFAPSLDGRQLRVDSRWEHIVGRDDARALFEDAAVAELSRAVFGFHVDAAGRLRRTAPVPGLRASRG
jgi:hypothetical protein